MTDFSDAHLYAAFPTTMTAAKVQFNNDDLRSLPMIRNVIL